jgi:Lrp/AsnC family transcriptional regulator for asnA, asnC and gidA
MKKANNTIKIDGIDKEIIRSLMNNARTPILEIAKRIGVSGAAIHQRLRKLENSELIEGSKIIINPKVLGYKTMAFIGIYLEKAGDNADVVRELKKIPEAIESHYTTGNWSILTKILCIDNENLMQILNKKIQTINGVSRTETYISLDQQINRQIAI